MSVLLFCLLHGLSISPISYIGGVKQREAAMCTFSRSKCQRSSSHKSFRIFLGVCYMAASLFDRFLSHVVQIQPMMWLCAMNHFQVTRSFGLFDVVASWPRSYLTIFPHMGHQYSPQGDDVSGTISRSTFKVKLLIRSRSFIFCFHLNKYRSEKGFYWIWHF